MLYRICGVVFRSNIPLAELPEAAGERPSGDCCLSDRPLSTDDPVWLHQWHAPNGDLRLSVARHRDGYLLRFPEGADFVVDSEGRRIVGHATRVPRDTLAHLLVDHVMPLALSRRFLVLHAGAIATDGGAVAFLGRSGHGKSTLTGSFCASGFPHLADDCLRVEREAHRARAIPAYPGLRLWDDALGAIGSAPAVSRVADFNKKKRVHVGRDLPFCDRVLPLRAAYVLTPIPNGHTDHVAPLSPREAAMELVAHSYRLDVTDRPALVSEIDRIDTLVRILPLFRLTYRRGFTRLAAIRAVILDHLAALAGEP